MLGKEVHFHAHIVVLVKMRSYSINSFGQIFIKFHSNRSSVWDLDPIRPANPMQTVFWISVASQKDTVVVGSPVEDPVKYRLNLQSSVSDPDPDPPGSTAFGQDPDQLQSPLRIRIHLRKH